MENNELDLNLDLDQIESNSEQKLQVKNRFQQLSDKVKTEAQEKDKALAEVERLKAEKEQSDKKAQFMETFSSLSAKHPEATNYREQILERVNKGYDPEEATLAVLAKEGKLGQMSQPVVRQQVEGGSAMTQMSETDKSNKDMSSDEKLIALLEMEKSGELTQALRAGINRS